MSLRCRLGFHVAVIDRERYEARVEADRRKQLYGQRRWLRPMETKCERCGIPLNGSRRVESHP